MKLLTKRLNCLESSLMRSHILGKAIFTVAFLFMFVLTAFLTGCQSEAIELKANFTRREEFDTTMHTKIEKQTISQAVNNRVKAFSIGAVGDLMFHNTQLSRAYDPNTGEYDFYDSFTHIKPYLHTVDYVFGNFESTLAGKDYSGYPMFTTPDSILDAITDAGIDFLSTGNNHSLDRGELGLKRTIEQLRERNIPFTGTYYSSEERTPFETVVVEGVNFAVINYTYGTNGLRIEGKMDLVNSLDYYDEEKLKELYEDVAAAEASEADYVIVMMHFGYEYQSLESDKIQKNIVKELIVNGADIVFGGHPHVLQPVELFYEMDGQSFEEPKVVIYSLGNFIASQRNVNKLGGNTDLGVIFNIYFETVDQRRPKIKGIGFLPTYTLWQANTITTIPITDDLSLLEEHALDINAYQYTPWDLGRIQFGQDYTVPHLMRYIDKEAKIGEPLYLENGFYRYDLN